MNGIFSQRVRTNFCCPPSQQSCGRGILKYPSSVSPSVSPSDLNNLMSFEFAMVCPSVHPPASFMSCAYFTPPPKKPIIVSRRGTLELRVHWFVQKPGFDYVNTCQIRTFHTIDSIRSIERYNPWTTMVTFSGLFGKRTFLGGCPSLSPQNLLLVVIL